MTNETIITLEGRRSHYSAQEAAERSSTISDLIMELEHLGEEYGWETKVVLSNDNGYTFGEILEGAFDLAEEE